MDEELRLTHDKPGPMIQFRSARGFEWNRLALPVEGLSPELDGLRILHLSDLHTRNYWDKAFDDLISELRGNPPDLILFTGDFVDCKRDHRPALEYVGRLMSGLTSRLGTFAILGNHDGDLIAPKLAEWNVHLIAGQRVQLKSHSAAIELIGLPGVERHDLDLSWARNIPQPRPGDLRIALCHFPDLIKKVEPLRPHLFLAGHTHGGQIAIPSRRWPIFRHDSLPRRLCRGAHRCYGTVLVVNRGLGFSSPLKLRFNCPAEVIEITVRRAETSELSSRRPASSQTGQI